MNYDEIDPFCVFHGQRRSKHFCLYCCLCWKTLTVDECYTNEHGDHVDVCHECAAKEAAALGDAS